MNGRRGMSLGTTLVMSALLVTLGFAVASLCVSHLQLSNLDSNRSRARALAEAAVAQAVAELQEDPDFGAGSGTPPVTVHFSNQDGEGWLGFGDGHPAERIPSRNNLRGLSTLDVDGVVIPAATARLVGEGTAGGVTEKVEGWLRIPALPVLATQGGLRSTGPLLVAAVESLAEVATLLADPEQAHQPGDVVSNLEGTGAIVLAPGTRITGDVQTTGDVSVSDPSAVKILGELRTFADPWQLPTVDLAEYDPVEQQLPYTELTGLSANPVVGGIARLQTPTLTVAGDLTLEQALFFVNGNVHIQGGVKGTGLLAVTGSLTVDRGCTLDGGTTLALMANGPVVLKGTGKSSSFIQGVVYTGATLEAEQVTVVGSLIAQSSADPAVTLNDCAVLGSEQSVNLPIRQPIRLSLGPKSMARTNPLLAFEVRRQGQRAYLHGFNKGTGNEFDLSFDLHEDTVPPQDVAVVRTQLTEAVLALLGQGTVLQVVLSGTTGVDYNFGARAIVPNNSLDPDTTIRRALEGIQQTILEKLQENGDSEIVTVKEINPSKFLRWEDRIRLALLRPLP